MDKISNLFGGLSSLRPPFLEERECFIRVTKKICGLDIRLDQTRYKNGVMFLKIKPIEKNVILLNLDKIKEEMKKNKLENVFKSIA